MCIMTLITNSTSKIHVGVIALLLVVFFVFISRYEQVYTLGARLGTFQLHDKQFYKDDLYHDDAVNLFHNLNLSYEMSTAIEGSPFDPLPAYKNPCWKSRLTDVEPYDNRGPFRRKARLQTEYKDTMRKLYSARLQQGVNWRLRCFPYFMLIGVMKSGTSDIFGRLIQHPEIHPSAVKEPWFWARYRMQQNVYNATFHEYADYFDLAAEEIYQHQKETAPGFYYPGVTMEGTPHYLTDYGNWTLIPGNTNKSQPKYILAHTIHALRPSMKFLLILRNPVDRLYSEFKMKYKKSSTTAEPFDTTVNSLIDGWKQCTKEYSHRECAYSIELRETFPCGFAFVNSMYYIFLNDWINIFERSQFYIVKGEDYYSNMSGELNKIYKFIGVRELKPGETSDLDELPIRNSRTREAMLLKTRRKLEKFYEPFNDQLAELLNDTRYLWT